MSLRGCCSRNNLLQITHFRMYITHHLAAGSGNSERGEKMRRTSGAPFVRLFLVAGVFALQLLGQGDRGVITGTVSDASGAIVPGASITVIQNGTNTSFRTMSNSAGDFTVPSLPVGQYQVRVAKPSF